MLAFIKKMEETEGPWLAFTRQKYEKRKPPRWIFASLSFSLFYFFPLLFDQSVTGLRLASGIAVYVLFVFCYFQIAFSSLRVSMMYLLVMIALCLTTHPISAGTSTLVGYCGFFIGYYFRLSIALSFYLLLMVLFGLSAWFFGLFNYWVIPTAVILLSGLFFIGSMSRAEDIARYKEHRSSEQIEQLATVAERERIARDLHDILGHTLTSIVLKTQLAEKLCTAGSPEAAKKEISEVTRIASEALSDLRTTVSGYKAKTINQLLNRLADQLVDKGMVATVDCDLSNLPAKVEAALSLILTEAVTNILRHSSATRVNITSERDGPNLKLVIKDNGEVVKPCKKGNGLQGMEERVLELGGQLSLSYDNGYQLDILLNLSGLAATSNTNSAEGLEQADGIKNEAEHHGGKS